MYVCAWYWNFTPGIDGRALLGLSESNILDLLAAQFKGRTARRVEEGTAWVVTGEEEDKVGKGLGSGSGSGLGLGLGLGSTLGSELEQIKLNSNKYAAISRALWSSIRREHRSALYARSLKEKKCNT